MRTKFLFSATALLSSALAVGCSSSDGATPRIDGATDAATSDGSMHDSSTRDAATIDSGNLQSDASSPSDSAMADANASDASSDASTLDGGTQAALISLNKPAGSTAFGCGAAVSRNGLVLAMSDCGLGEVSIYRRANQGGAWIGPERLVHAAGTSGYFGFALALSDDGTTLAVGDRNGGDDNNENGDGEGIVRVYDWNGNTWSESPDMARPVGAYTFGFAVALSASGDVLAVGDMNYNPGQASPTEGPGGVFVYRRGTASASWSGPETFAGITGSEDLGYSVALSADGNVLAMGDRKHAETGGVFVSRHNGSSWSERSALPLPTGAQSFGFHLGMSDDASVLVVGDTYGNPGTEGSAHVYRLNPSGQWNEETRFARPALSYGFGARIAVSQNAQIVYVGDGLGGANDSGQVSRYVYANGAWQGPTVLAPSRTETASFGHGVATDGTGASVAIGARNSNEAFAAEF